MRVLLILTSLIGLSLFLAWNHMIRMPGESYSGELPELSESQKLLATRLFQKVEVLSDTIGERNVYQYDALLEAASFIEEYFDGLAGDLRRQEYEVNGKLVWNIELELAGIKYPEEIVIIGAHYDTHPGTPGANDNGSGVAALLLLAEHFSKNRANKKTLRFVAFVNEEMPFFSTPDMGSRVYARESYDKEEQITAMISLETIGYYSEREHTQNYPFPVGFFYPTKGNFIAFVGNLSSRGLVESSIKVFRESVEFPSEGASLPEALPGIGWSDHSSFWKHGYEAFMLTDTAPFRYPYYHLPGDTPDKLDYESMARVVEGMQRVIEELVSS